ncbi:MAG: hypothetical protein A2Y17_01410 [Clostridiales bacterium GWF2_38_85]|nr:MAG: hypothetical protein A2Y17_01410 [Clostridiales bacterium GWF2_38_85]HBL85178.1 RNA polymerase subunit sigma [Clostridiales bacterium]
MKEIDGKALLAKNNDELLADFIDEQKQYILSCTYRATKKYITNSDDEWSVALIAFSDAVKSYDGKKSEFLTYAETIIKNRLIDYFRSEQKHRFELTVNPKVFENEPDDDDEELSIKLAVAEKLSVTKDDSIKYEIEALNVVFKKFGFSFFDLADCSPKSIKTKEACKKAVLFVLDNKLIFQEIYETKKLPIKKIQQNIYLPRKLLEHHRKYIIAAMVILSGEYPYLAEYMSFIRKRGATQ